MLKRTRVGKEEYKCIIPPWVPTLPITLSVSLSPLAPNVTKTSLRRRRMQTFNICFMSMHCSHEKTVGFFLLSEKALLYGTGSFVYYVEYKHGLCKVREISFICS